MTLENAFRDRVLDLVRLTTQLSLVQNTRVWSTTLASTYEVIGERGSGRTDTVTAWSPYFWSGILDQGRGKVSPLSKEFLVWFRDPRADPRLRGGYPRKRTDQRRMSRAQFKKWQKRNAQARAAGRPEPMIVTRGPSKAVAGAHFVAASKEDIIRRVKQDIPEIARTVVEARLREVKKRRIRLRF